MNYRFPIGERSSKNGMRRRTAGRKKRSFVFVTSTVMFVATLTVQLALDLQSLTEKSFRGDRFKNSLNGKAQADAEIEAHRAEHRKNFHHVRQSLANYSTENSNSTTLIMLNTFSDPITVSITAFSPKGSPFSLPSAKLMPITHFELSLNEALQDAGAEFREGSLILDYQGEEVLIGAWVVMQKGKQATEMPFADATKFKSSRLVSFWDVRPLAQRTVEPTFSILNTSGVPLDVRVTLTENGQKEGTHSLRLAPFAREIISPRKTNRESRSGFISIEHGGLPGDVVCTGLLEGGTFRSQLPVFDPATFVSTTLHAVRIPSMSREKPDNLRGVSLLSLFNTTQESQNATISVFDSRTGEELANSRCKNPG